MVEMMIRGKKYVFVALGDSGWRKKRYFFVVGLIVMGPEEVGMLGNDVIVVTVAALIVIDKRFSAFVLEYSGGVTHIHNKFHIG